jgi:hypothetical protein
VKQKKCKVCKYEYDREDVESGVCRGCAAKRRFGDFARSCGLARFPDPSGERYVYNADGSFAGKKGEETDLIDELWDALVRAKGGDPALLLTGGG